MEHGRYCGPLVIGEGKQIPNSLLFRNRGHSTGTAHSAPPRTVPGPSTNDPRIMDPPPPRARASALRGVDVHDEGTRTAPGPQNTHRGCRQPMCDPKECATVLGVVGGDPPPFADPNPRGKRVGRSATRVPRGGGGGGDQWVPQHTLPQNDPHDALIISNIQRLEGNRRRLEGN